MTSLSVSRIHLGCKNSINRDSETDKRGNRDLIAICSGNIVFYAFVFFFYRTINKRRDRIWNSWTPEVRVPPFIYFFLQEMNMLLLQEQKKYLETTTDQGNKRLDFRFAY